MILTPVAGQNILTRCLPKTGQETEYQAGDDGTYEAGWWKGRLNLNNRVRFVSKTIGGDVVVLDRATGLMWAANGNAAGCNNGARISWSNGITYANGLTFAGFSDWRLPNLRELMSIINWSLINPAISQPPFLNSKYDYGSWSSTTCVWSIEKGWAVTFDFGWNYYFDKTLTKYIRCVRKGL